MRTYAFRSTYASCRSFRLRRQAHHVVFGKSRVRLDARAVQAHLPASQPFLYKGVRRKRKDTPQVTIDPLSRIVGFDAARLLRLRLQLRLRLRL